MEAVERAALQFHVEARSLRLSVGLFPVASKYCQQRRLSSLGWGFERMVTAVRLGNDRRRQADAAQWTLHARTHANADLQAWYHATFAKELYRPRGAFWWKEAILPEYTAHPTDEDAPPVVVEGDFEEKDDDDGKAALLCSPNTIYTAMAATMYTIRATLSEKEYALFEALTTEGVMVLKHPFRSAVGRPQKKRFQLSLVQGDMYLFMYLTWKGKHGMQGIELASVNKVTLRSSDDDPAEGCRLDLAMPDRSLELGYETSADAELWRSCLSELVNIESDVAAASRVDKVPLAPASPPALQQQPAPLQKQT